MDSGKLGAIVTHTSFELRNSSQRLGNPIEKPLSRHRRIHSEISRSKDLTKLSQSGLSKEGDSLFTKVWKLKHSFSNLSTQLSADLIQEEEHMLHMENILAKLRTAVFQTQVMLRTTEHQSSRVQQGRANNNSMNMGRPYARAGERTSRPRLLSGSMVNPAVSSRDSTPPVELEYSPLLSYRGRTSSHSKRHGAGFSPRIYSPGGGKLSGERTVPKIQVTENDYIIRDDKDQTRPKQKENQSALRSYGTESYSNLLNSAPTRNVGIKKGHQKKGSELSDILQQSRSGIRKSIQECLRSSYQAPPLDGAFSQSSNGIQANDKPTTTGLYGVSGTSTKQQSKASIYNQEKRLKTEPESFSHTKHRRTNTKPDEQIDTETDHNYVLVRTEIAHTSRVNNFVAHPQSQPSKNEIRQHTTQQVPTSLSGHSNFNRKPALSMAEGPPSSKQPNNEKPTRVVPAKTSQPLESLRQGVCVPEKSSSRQTSEADQRGGEQTQHPKQPVLNVFSTRGHVRTLSGVSDKTAPGGILDSYKSNKLDKIFSVGLLAKSSASSLRGSLNGSKNTVSEHAKQSANNWLKLYRPETAAAVETHGGIQESIETSPKNRQSQGEKKQISGSGVMFADGSLGSLEELQQIKEDPDSVQHEFSDVQPARANTYQPARHSQTVNVTLGNLQVGQALHQPNLEMIPEVSKDVSQPTGKRDSTSNFQMGSLGNKPSYKSSSKGDTQQRLKLS